jgi:hypothetical protein
MKMEHKRKPPLVMGRFNFQLMSRLFTAGFHELPQCDAVCRQRTLHQLSGFTHRQPVRFKGSRFFSAPLALTRAELAIPLRQKHPSCANSSLPERA